METIGYVISAKMDDGKLEYLCIDSESGGYPYWGASSLRNIMSV